MATPTRSTSRVLFVADEPGDRIGIYSIPDLDLLGELDGVAMAAHGGTFLLPDGWLVFADDANSEIVALRVGEDGTPEVTDRTPAELGGAAAWGSASSDLSTIAFGSLTEDSETQVLNVLEVASFTTSALEFERLEPEEIHSWLYGDRLHLHVAVSGQVNSYVLADALAGNLEPLSTVPVEMGSHGGTTDATNAQLFLTTGPGTGFEVMDVSAGRAEYVTQVR